MTPTDKQKCIAEQAVYGDLRIQVGDSIRITNGAFTEYRGEYVRYVEFECRDSTGMLNINKIKPILRPMSDLTKEITHKGYNDDKPFVPINFVNIWWVDNMTVVKIYDLLHLWHFDTRNLIDKGEAIDVNTLPNNPYSV